MNPNSNICAEEDTVPEGVSLPPPAPNPNSVI